MRRKEVGGLQGPGDLEEVGPLLGGQKEADKGMVGEAEISTGDVIHLCSLNLSFGKPNFRQN